MDPSPNLPANGIGIWDFGLTLGLNSTVLDSDAMLLQGFEDVPERNITVTSSGG